MIQEISEQENKYESEAHERKIDLKKCVKFFKKNAQMIVSQKS